MKTERGTYKGWDAVYCYGKDCTLIVGVSAGPRILFFSCLNGVNLLYEDHTGFKVGDWQLYGGHRFTIAPESDRSYLPDNEGCEVFVDEGSLIVYAPCTSEGIQKSIKISPDSSGFAIEHALSNKGENNWEGALWAITCVPPGGNIVAGIDSDHVQIWPNTKKDLWRLDGNQISIQPDGTRGKIGWYSQHARIASVMPDYLFSIRVPQITPVSQCVDGGCNVDLFFCKDFYELETLSGLVVLAPEQSTSHVERWRL